MPDTQHRTSDDYVRSYEDRVNYLEDLGGLPWHRAPRPRRFHCCWPQTRGFMSGMWIERCACGAVRTVEMRWADRNSRRRDR